MGFVFKKRRNTEFCAPGMLIRRPFLKRDYVMSSGMRFFFRMKSRHLPAPGSILINAVYTPPSARSSLHAFATEPEKPRFAHLVEMTWLIGVKARRAAIIAITTCCGAPRGVC